MVRWRSGRVISERCRWRGAIEYQVRLDPRSPDDPDTVRALAYPELVGTPQAGDRVLLNTNALALSLGTGGYALVVAVPDRLPADPTGPGHVVKARYTPLQAVVQAVDEDGAPHRAAVAGADDLAGMPVVLADLHSALPAVLAAIPARIPVAYLMTDGGALPAWFSRTLDGLSDRLCGTVTAGQAFGGDLEAATVHAGLLACRYALGAAITIVSQGPGNLGTGTRWGYSGVTVGEAVNAVAVLGGRPVGSLRISDADPRPRHQGLSHHSRTAYGRVALAGADLVVPTGLAPALADRVAADLRELPARHRIVEVDGAGLLDALRASPVRLSTMGRGLDQDTGYFLAAAAAGRHAADLLG
ncbi:DUF3866 family protein [Actinocatenispora thailandica]|uniref:DUF3866 family protein n=1 Tax=Actinocatenispora thailandica TaxID=227318 RepID=UPI00194E8B30|nr:DUF3866 family protein [Actinocatenispora thailandica]